MKLSAAITAIHKQGMLLVFPIANSPEPKSLWSVAYPRSKMLWEWDNDGDDRVAKLWHLREELSRSGEVVYTKWYRGRATFFSPEVFTALLAHSLQNKSIRSLPPDSKQILAYLQDDSPLSTKVLKREAGLQGKLHEGIYTRALKELWDRFLIVGFGEVDEGAFPSLAIGATEILFENLYAKARALTPHKIEEVLNPFFRNVPLAQKFWTRRLDKSLIRPTDLG